MMTMGFSEQNLIDALLRSLNEERVSIRTANAFLAIGIARLLENPEISSSLVIPPEDSENAAVGIVEESIPILAVFRFGEDDAAMNITFDIVKGVFEDRETVDEFLNTRVQNMPKKRGRPRKEV